jgi:hypothetical protein
MLTARKRHPRPSNIAGLQTEAAKTKRAAYFSSELHRQRASAQAKKLADDRRSGLVPPPVYQTSNTKPELAVRSVLESMGLDFKSQYPVGPYLFDFYLPEHKIFIEVQGEYWHSIPGVIRNDLAKESYVSAQVSDHRIIYITELDTLKFQGAEKVIRSALALPAENVELKLDEVTVADAPREDIINVLQSCHYLPRLRKTYRVGHGIYHDGKIIGAIVYGLPTYYWVSAQYGLKPGNVLELIRLALLPGYNVKNLLSYCLSRSVKLIKRNNAEIVLLVSFADPHFGHDGGVYRAANWQADGLTLPSYYYLDGAGSIIHKRTLWDHASKMGVSESQYAENNNCRRIDTPPKHKFIYRLKPAVSAAPIAYKNKKIEATCIGVCGEKFTVTKSAYDRAVKKNNGYICQSCALKQKWSDPAYAAKVRNSLR